MPFYKSTDQLYDSINLAFNRIVEQHPSAMESLEKSKLVIRFQVHDPEAEIVLDGRTQPVQTILGPSSDKADIEVALTADALHQIMLGELGILKALGAKKVKLNGSMRKVKALSPLFRQSQEIYPEVLAEKGLR